MTDDRSPTSIVYRSRIQEFFATAEKLAKERRTAPHTIPPLIKSCGANFAALQNHPYLANCGAIEYLGTLANQALNSTPQFALSLAKLAADISETLPEANYPRITRAQTRAHAWKEYGKALRYLARCSEALDALYYAESCLDDSPILLAHDLAIVRFNTAVVLQELNRCDESLGMLAECKRVLRDHGDTRLVVLAAYTEGVGLQRLRKFREARETYLLLLASTADIEKETLASLHQSIGHCCVDLGDYEAAEANLQKAIQLHYDLGQPLQALKGEMGRGRLFLQTGDHERVVSHLRPVRRDFIRKSMSEEAGLCGLAIVQALLLLERVPEAENLARKILHEFVTAELNQRAVTALAYLVEAVSNRNATPSLANEVREYVISLRTTPERDFDRALIMG
jgi:tetratricopeptide (TPR) repeat protein